MSLLHEDALERAKAAVGERRRSRQRVLRQAMHGVNGTEDPAGYVRLKTAEDRDVWTGYLAQQAQREQEGFIAGDAAQRAVANPAVAEVMPDGRT